MISEGDEEPACEPSDLNSISTESCVWYFELRTTKGKLLCSRKIGNFWEVLPHGHQNVLWSVPNLSTVMAETLWYRSYRSGTASKGMDGSQGAHETWHFVAGLEYLKRDLERKLFKAQPQLHLKVQDWRGPGEKLRVGTKEHGQDP